MLIMQPLVILLLISTGIASALCQGTSDDFYLISCPRVKDIVRATVRSHLQTKPTNAPGLLRMFFHDCMVQGCDGSILIDGPLSEKSAPPNSLLRGFDVIDDAKAQLEAACPGVVSCADILAIAARDAVVLSSGLSWEVQMGRRDGLVSSASDTVTLPGFSDSVAVQIQKFADKGLNTQDLVTLVGGHTIGTASCFTFVQRLYNFTAIGGPDPSINPGFLSDLQALCPPNGNPFARVPLDTGSVDHFDTSYYSNLRSSQGLLESDQLLWADSRTQPFVQRLIDRNLRFGIEFGNAMVKLGNVGVKTGTNGEIRRVCNATN